MKIIKEFDYFWGYRGNNTDWFVGVISDEIKINNDSEIYDIIGDDSYGVFDDDLTPLFSVCRMNYIDYLHECYDNHAEPLDETEFEKQKNIIKIKMEPEFKQEYFD